MSIAPRLELRQHQALVLTPQLQQAIKLLQLSNTELSAYIETELEKNPLLDRDDGTGPSEPSAFETTDFESNSPGPGSEALEASETTQTSLLDSLEQHNVDDLPDASSTPLDTDYDSRYDSVPDNQWNNTDTAFSNWGPGGNTRFDDEYNSLENRLVSKPTLRQHLLNQLSVDIENPKEKLIAAHMVELLDDSGYLSTPLQEIAFQLGTGPDEVEKVLTRLQGFDPLGVFARNLRECFALQLREKDRLDPVMALFLDNLELLAKHDLVGLMKACQCDQDDITDMIAEIRALNPRPASSFEQVTVEPVIPDVLINADGKGGWHVELNNDALPKVLVNSNYYNHVTGMKLDRDELSYLSEQYQTANWLAKALQQRATTILRVASEIARLQDDFFRRGIGGLRPLVLKDVASAIEMHESTVSRVTNSKFMATPRGTFELKFFFSSSVGGNGIGGGKSHSAPSVKARIKALINGEPPKRPFSDDALVRLLKEEEIQIARRTVAKYREAIGIGSSSQRKKEKAFRL